MGERREGRIEGGSMADQLRAAGLARDYFTTPAIGRLATDSEAFAPVRQYLEERSATCIKPAPFMGIIHRPPSNQFAGEDAATVLSTLPQHPDYRAAVVDAPMPCVPTGVRVNILKEPGSYKKPALEFLASFKEKSQTHYTLYEEYAMLLKHLGADTLMLRDKRLFRVPLGIISGYDHSIPMLRRGVQKLLPPVVTFGPLQLENDIA